MRAPLDVMMRWWNQAVGRGNGNGYGNGQGHANGNGHRNGNGRGNGNGHRPAAANGVPHPPHEEATAAAATPAAPEPPWLTQLDREGIPRSLNYPTTTLGRIIDQAADRFGDRTAIVYNQRRWTYADLLARVNRM